MSAMKRRRVNPEIMLREVLKELRAARRRRDILAEMGLDIMRARLVKAVAAERHEAAQKRARRAARTRKQNRRGRA